MSADKEIVVIGADHNGVILKSEVKDLLKELGYRCVDVGAHEATTKVDYVDYARTVGEIIDKNEADKGVLICGTGAGMSMVANRFANVRASLAHSRDVAQKAREHNDANVLCLGAWVNTPEENLNITRTWLDEPFGEERHVKRVEKTKTHSMEKIVFTNGVFDILHPGHIQLLKFAKSLGGRLIVGINSDRAVKLLKGENRPVNAEEQRKSTLESLSFVDEVVIFDDTKTVDIIAKTKPHVVVKGGEWTAREVRERDEIPLEIEVKVFPLVKDGAGAKFSTTGIIEKIKKGLLIGT
ncbi:ribose 5-phosphate isomerase B [Candidatus Kaiserbacteria bacterium RIFCSPLOWO2_01_FULL_54_13]|uniref:Ribose 5-phosphate isomerase B n=1 Tax=Candidatus Kaiserbacteria bacterium RIFCSPLOWO2_01_FULL_54_13 TaxID=1798512 RepID=A0A1F6F158_9BACT|nr:MAG: ribose 5-phosphate isomerase B [Candidatus Kaiserbacteria bacterium RIFCSPLOWO2_01_FULL_54_13]